MLESRVVSLRTTGALAAFYYLAGFLLGSGAVCTVLNFPPFGVYSAAALGGLYGG